MSLRIAPCRRADLDAMLRGLPVGDAEHIHHRYALQARGGGLFLLAWHEGELVGQVTLMWQSKYPEVRQAHSDLAELNALEAIPHGQGTGSALIAEAERLSREHGASGLGMAVAPANTAARRLYERLGYRLTGAQVIDRWSHVGPDGVRVHHADSCDHLVKTF